jgi:hypothetical protein
MARGNDESRNEARIVSMQQWKMRNHPASGGLQKGINLFKDVFIGGPANPDLDDPNTPEYTGQEARISDLSPRNIYRAMAGEGGKQPPKKPKTKLGGAGDDKPKKNSNDEAPPHGMPRPKYPERESREDKYRNGWYN